MIEGESHSIKYKHGRPRLVKDSFTELRVELHNSRRVGGRHQLPGCVVLPWCTVAVTKCIVTRSWCTVAVTKCIVTRSWCTVAVTKCIVTRSWCIVAVTKCMVLKWLMSKSHTLKFTNIATVTVWDWILLRDYLSWRISFSCVFP